MRKKKQEPKKTKKSFERTVYKVCKLLQKCFAMEHFDFSLYFSDQVHCPKDGSGEAIAYIVVNEEYLTFSITLYPAAFEEYQKKDCGELFHNLVHEFCHTVTTPLYHFSGPYIKDKGDDHLIDKLTVAYERSTEMMTKLILNQSKAIIDIERHLK